ncbi:MAG: hypothetical protein KatS3mg008_2149 [Acidimicrobiales bacterium]|nr:MAG: hypothetical protein KatS3mg008_2149 [Acidimicrobiales bacterium]
MGLFVVAAALASCGSGGEATSERTSSTGGKDNEQAATTTTTAGPPEKEIVIKILSFQPSELIVEAGTRVRWRNEDTQPHTATSGRAETTAVGGVTVPSGQFDSGAIPAGRFFEQTFDKPGRYPFYCKIHPSTMRGEVVVTKPVHTKTG